jgi:hypothetical protein
MSLAATQRAAQGRTAGQIRRTAMIEKKKTFGQRIGKFAKNGLGCRQLDTLTLEEEGEEFEYTNVLEIHDWPKVSANMAEKMHWDERQKKSEKQKEKHEAMSENKKKAKHANRLNTELGHHNFKQIGTDPRTGAKAGTVKTTKTRVNGQTYYYIHKDGFFNANNNDMLAKIASQSFG